MYIDIYIHTHYIYTHYIYIYSSSGVQVQEQIHCLVGWLSKRPTGFICLLGDRIGAWVCCQCLRHSSLHGFLDVRIVFLPSTCCSFSSPRLKLVLLSAQGPPGPHSSSCPGPDPPQAPCLQCILFIISILTFPHPAWFSLSITFRNLSLMDPALKPRTPRGRTP